MRILRLQLYIYQTSHPLSSQSNREGFTASFNAFDASPSFEHNKASGTGDARHRTEQPQKFPRLSKPVELLRPTYDVIVIGSGYGGGVSASRMARGGQSVCVLERGKEKWPGEYPSEFSEVIPNFHIQGMFTPGNRKGTFVEGGDPTGLYRLTLGDGLNVFQANGLGGTSLLNANIFLPADKKTLSMNDWPTHIRNNPESLDKYYERAASVLEPTPYPTSYPELAKLDLLQKQAAALGLEQNFYRPPQTTRFKDGPNSTGVTMHASTGSGMDTTGVNDGSKSSTLVNYLSDAWNWGAEMFCECEVRIVKKAPKGDGYIIFFAWHGAKRRDFGKIFEEDLMWVHAKHCVFMAAGTLGTTEILLRSKEHGLPMSHTVGTRMSGNGDILAFGYNTDYEVNAMARKHPKPSAPVGPTITGIIDCRDQEDPMTGFVIEEGAVPLALVAEVQILMDLIPGKIFPGNWGLLERFRHFISGLQNRVFGPYSRGASAQRTQIYLIMSHDSDLGTLTLNESNNPILEFEGLRESKTVTTLNALLAKATSAVGGTFINNPFFAGLGEQEVSVHPIGGAAMSSDGTAAKGATTAHGELLTGSGKEYHNGLICVDGSVVPTALGVNPFATITALAEHSVEHAATTRGIKIDYKTKNGLLDLFGPPAKKLALTPDLKEAAQIIKDARRGKNSGTEFTQVMEGFIHVGGGIGNFAEAEEAARAASSSARFFLSAQARDTSTSVDHPAVLTGTFSCHALSKDPFMVLGGKIQLVGDNPSTKKLSYDCDIVSTNGEMFHFNGSSVAHWRTWEDTSTLHVTLTHLKNSSVVGRGVLHIKPITIGSEVASFFATVHMISRAGGEYIAYLANQATNVLFARSSPVLHPQSEPLAADEHSK